MLTTWFLFVCLVIDSYGRPSAGFLDGTVTSLGDYDECLRVEFPKFYGDEIATVGKYCILRLNFPVPRKPARIRYHEPLVNLNGTNLHETVWSHLAKHINSVYTVKGFRFGVCLPSTCSVEELEPLIRRCKWSTAMIGWYSRNCLYWSNSKKSVYLFQTKQSPSRSAFQMKH